MRDPMAEDSRLILRCTHAERGEILRASLPGTYAAFALPILLRAARRTTGSTYLEMNCAVLTPAEVDRDQREEFAAGVEDSDA